MAGFEGFTNFIKKKIAKKKETEDREKDPTSSWKGVSESQKERHRRLSEAFKKRKASNEKKKSFFKKYGFKK